MAEMTHDQQLDLLAAGLRYHHEHGSLPTLDPVGLTAFLMTPTAITESRPAPVDPAALVRGVVDDPAVAAKLINWPHLPTFLDDIHAGRYESIARWALMLRAAGMLTVEQHQALGALLTQDPVEVKIGEGPTPLTRLFSPGSLRLWIEDYDKADPEDQTFPTQDRRPLSHRYRGLQNTYPVEDIAEALRRAGLAQEDSNGTDP